MTEKFYSPIVNNRAITTSAQRWIYILMSGLLVGLVSSQSLMDLFILLVSLLSLGLVIKKRDWSFVSSIAKWIYISVGWVLCFLVGIKFQGGEGSSIKPILGDFAWIIHLPLWFYLWTQIKVSQKWIVTALGILSIASLFAVVVYFLGFDPLHQHWNDRALNAQGFWRSGGLFSNAMALAQSYGPLAIVLLPLAVYYFGRAWFTARKDSWNWKQLFPTTVSWLVPCTFILTSFAVLLTFTRGVWLAMVVSALVGSFLWNRKTGVIVLLVMTLGLGGLLGAWTKLRDRTFQSFDTKTSYDSERVVLWQTNWHIFTENPWMGIGYGENKRRLREFYDQLNVPPGQFEGHAHNQYLHFLAGTGIIGLSFYLFWCFSFLRMNYRIYQKYAMDLSSEESTPWALFFLGLFLAQIAFHIGSLTESNFIIAKNRMLIVFIWSLILYFYHKTLISHSFSVHKRRD